MLNSNILITGASGYIGSCAYFFLKEKYKLHVVDKNKNHYFKVNQCDLLNKDKLNNLLSRLKLKLIIHLEAQSLVDETINKKKYYKNNVLATKNLIELMKKNSINNIIFSSTAAVYKFKNKPLIESDKINPKSTYALTKHLCEKMLLKSKLNVVILRFFNVCSALKNPKLIGEFHNPETHLIPTATYKNIFKKKIYLYGDNYLTNDGTCIRDYVHISDICGALDKSIKYMNNKIKINQIINIGGSNKLTNLQIIRKIETITKIKSNFIVVKKRPGDVATLSCSIKKAKKILKWKPNKSNINIIIKDELRWIKNLIATNKKRTFKSYLAK